MIRLPRIERIAGWMCVVVATLSWSSSPGATLERSLATLEKERSAHQKELSRARDVIRSFLDDLEARFRSAGTPESISHLERLAVVRERFTTSDEPPEISPERATRRIPAVRARLRAALREAIAQCLAAKREDDARSLRDELNTLERSPWGVFERMQPCPPPESVGEWKALGEELRTQSNGGGAKYVEFGDPAWTDYNLEVDVMAERQGELSITFRAHDGNRWKLDFCAFGNKDNMDLLAAVKGEDRWKHESRKWMPNAIAMEFGRWYHVRIEARGTTVKVFVENELRAQSQHTALTAGRIGANTFGTTEGRFRDFRVTSPEGVLLWLGVPRKT